MTRSYHESKKLVEAAEHLHAAGLVHGRILEEDLFEVKRDNGQLVVRSRGLKHIGSFRKDDKIHIMIFGLKEAKIAQCRVRRGRPCCTEMQELYKYAGIKPDAERR